MNNAKILWGEGLFLRPQHFQHQDSYTEAQSRRVLLAANPFAWGVRDLKYILPALLPAPLFRRLVGLAGGRA